MWTVEKCLVLLKKKSLRAGRGGRGQSGLSSEFQDSHQTSKQQQGLTLVAEDDLELTFISSSQQLGLWDYGAGLPHPLSFALVNQSFICKICISSQCVLEANSRPSYMLGTR